MGLMLFLAFPACAQCEIGTDSIVTFKLHEGDGHYYVNSDINGTPTKIWLYTGPGLIVDEKFFEKHKDEWKLDIKSVKGVLRNLTKNDSVMYSGRTYLHIGNAIFNGPIIVVKGHKKIIMPLQGLGIKHDKSSIVKLDLPNKRMTLITRHMLAKDSIDCSAFSLKKSQKEDLPVIQTRVAFRTNNKIIQMDGNFIINIGNANLLSLSTYNADVSRMIKDYEIELKPAWSRFRHVVSDGILADRCYIAGYIFGQNSIVVTDKFKYLEAGTIGLKFFVTPVIFDFSKKKMYIKKKENWF